MHTLFGALYCNTFVLQALSHHSGSVWTYLFKELPVQLGARACERGKTACEVNDFRQKSLNIKTNLFTFQLWSFHTWWFRIRKRLQKRSPFLFRFPIRSDCFLLFGSLRSVWLTRRFNDTEEWNEQGKNNEYNCLPCWPTVSPSSVPFQFVTSHFLC